MSITASLVAQLRDLTGAGMMDAKRALEETGGNLARAAEGLRKKGIAKAAKKAERETKEGRVHSYLHVNGKLGAMVEVLCETDFVARNAAFISLCNDLAMQVAASDPRYLRREDVPLEIVEKEKSIYLEEIAVQDKPTDIVAKIIAGKLNNFFSDTCLLEQAYIKDENKTVDELIKETIAVLGENIQIRRFCRFNIA